MAGHGVPSVRLEDSIARDMGTCEEDEAGRKAARIGEEEGLALVCLKRSSFSEPITTFPAQQNTTWEIDSATNKYTVTMAYGLVANCAPSSYEWTAYFQKLPVGQAGGK